MKITAVFILLFYVNGSLGFPTQWKKSQTAWKFGTDSSDTETNEESEVDQDGWKFTKFKGSADASGTDESAAGVYNELISDDDSQEIGASGEAGATGLFSGVQTDTGLTVNADGTNELEGESLSGAMGGVNTDAGAGISTLHRKGSLFSGVTVGSQGASMGSIHSISDAMAYGKKYGDGNYVAHGSASAESKSEGTAETMAGAGMQGFTDQTIDGGQNVGASAGAGAEGDSALANSVSGFKVDTSTSDLGDAGGFADFGGVSDGDASAGGYAEAAAGQNELGMEMGAISVGNGGDHAKESIGAVSAEIDQGKISAGGASNVLVTGDGEASISNAMEMNGFDSDGTHQINVGAEVGADGEEVTLFSEAESSYNPDDGGAAQQFTMGEAVGTDAAVNIDSGTWIDTKDSENVNGGSHSSKGSASGGEVSVIGETWNLASDADGNSGGALSAVEVFNSEGDSQSNTGVSALFINKNGEIQELSSSSNTEAMGDSTSSSSSNQVDHYEDGVMSLITDNTAKAEGQGLTSVTTGGSFSFGGVNK